MKHTLKTIRLKKIMDERQITNAELSRRTTLNAAMIGWIRNGRFIPYESQLVKMAEALGVDDPESLIEIVEEES